ncbi:Nn.00g073280.m01.CDS01 [Neocucurbitaria sp. VM-36]
MSAQRIAIYTIDFPDPYAIDYDNNKFNTLNDSISFQYRILSNFQTLSTKGVDAGSDPYGILYVPDLHTEACRNQELAHVAANATRLRNLPAGKNYALIAVTPWFSPQCQIEYFSAARQAPTKAVFAYQPGTSNAKPPVLNDPSWNLQDGGGWQSANDFPTYALSSMTGNVIMGQLEQYSGNLSDVPHGDTLAQMFDPSDYVRLWATVSTDSGNQLPSLWVFLVIVMAILLVAVSVTSLAMHIIQRRRRNSLRQRVLNGEVDLEALGVKRLNVSQQVLDKLPIYTFTTSSAQVPEKAAPQLPVQALHLPSPSVDAETDNKTSHQLRRSSVPAMSTSGMSASFSQPTCPICLDDFEPNVTQVRELPCRHVFHPDCIDTFLLRNSSLCPMCKQTVLPKGDCPVRITNVMVRRERHIARMRARSAQTANGQPSGAPSHSVATPLASTARQPGTFGSLGSRIGGAITGRRIFSAPERTQSRPPDIEMANSTNTSQASAMPSEQVQSNDTPPVTSTQTTTRDCEPTQNRREWARQRALAMLGNRHAPPSDLDEEDTGPRWRRTLRKAFPGFR